MVVYTNNEAVNVESMFEVKSLNLENLFKGFTATLREEVGIYRPQDIFKVINLYQNYMLDGIEKANTEKHRVALGRTLIYSNEYLIKTFKKAKNDKAKESVLFKIINNFVLQVPSLEYVKSCSMYEEMYDIITTHKHLITDRDWYIRHIPESAWLLDLLEVKYEK